MLDILSPLDHSALAHTITWSAVIFASTFVFEDGAAALASVFVLDHLLSTSTALVALYLGVVASDVGLYGLGLTARRFRWANRLVDQTRIQDARKWIGGRLAFAIVLSRLVPWMLPPTFIACGFFGLPFRRFFALVSLTAAVWAAVVFALMLRFGAAALSHSGVWRWSIIAAACVLFFIWRLGPGAVYGRTGSAGSRRGFASAEAASMLDSAGDQPLSVPRVAFAERLPPWLFYFPVALLWIGLAIRYRSLTLPTAANPGFEAGGLCGESKLQVFSQLSAEGLKWVAPFTSIRRSANPDTPATDLAAALQALAAAGLDFPVVAKPDKGHHGHGVRPLFDCNELAAYIEQFPASETIVLQRLVEFPEEAGVFYIRLPGQRRGRIFSLCFSESPKVIGDGISSMGTLIDVYDTTARRRRIYRLQHARHLDRVPGKGEIVPLIFVRSLRLGATLRNANHLVSPELLARFDSIADNINEFYFGRFEIRFHSLGQLQKGEDFQILEINGAGAEANHIWDGGTRLIDSYRTLFEQFRLVFEIGDLNRKRGFKPMSLPRLVHLCIDQQRVIGQLPKFDSG